MFPGFLGPEAFKLFVTPAQQAKLVCCFQLRYFASCGSRDEARTAACGGCSVRAEINRNEQCPLVASSAARLRARNSLIAARNPRFPKGVARGVRGLATIELAEAHRPGGGPQRPENMPFGMFSARGRNARKTIRCLIAFGSWFSVEAGPEGPGRPCRAAPSMHSRVLSMV